MCEGEAKGKKVKIKEVRRHFLSFPKKEPVLRKKMKIEGDEIGLAIGTIANSEVTTGMSIPYSLLIAPRRGAMI